MGTVNFKFAPQCDLVNVLIAAATKVLDVLTDEEAHTELVGALRFFEKYSVATAWADEDIDREDALDLSSDERQNIMAHFIEGYEVTECEWDQLDQRTHDVFLASRRA